MGAPNCPRPSKRGFKTAEAAKRQLWHLWSTSKDPDRGLLGTYRCRCGLYHVGHARWLAKRKSVPGHFHDRPSV